MKPEGIATNITTATMNKREEVIETLKEKSALKQLVFDNTYKAFLQLKEILEEYAVEVNDELEPSDRRIRMEYRDRGKFEAQLQVAGDILIFSMHTNVFQFPRESVIWKTAYVDQQKSNCYCGMINIYNFLADSFRYNRSADEGYLIGRIFINRENQYLVEGKRQISARHESFGENLMTQAAILDILENAIKYTLEFDLLVPPYDVVKLVTVEQMNTKIENSKLQTGKRLGYQYNSDDV